MLDLPLQLWLDATDWLPRGNLHLPVGRGMAAASSAAKRGRPEDDAAPSRDERAVTFGDLDGIMKNFHTALAENVTKAAGTQVENLFRKYDEKIQARLSDHEATMAELSRRGDQVERSQEAMKQDVERLQRALAVAENSVNEVAASAAVEDFDRPPDPTIFRMNTSEQVARSAVREAIGPLILEAGIPVGQWDLLGDANGIGRNFAVRLSGAGSLAARRVKKIMSLRRAADGSWRENVKVNTPLGRQVEIYLSFDKNPKQLRTEQGSRKLFKAFKAVHPSKQIHVDKRSGIVSVDWHACAKLVPNPEPNSFVVQWNAAIVARAEVNKPAIMEAFNAASGSDAGIQWEI